MSDRPQGPADDGASLPTGPSGSSEPDHVVENRRFWDESAPDWVAAGERAWAGEPTWGTWAIPETELGLLPDDATGMRCIELGCGTGYVSGWLARRGATVVGVDVSAAQLATARRLAAENGVDLVLHEASAEAVPEPDASFDLAISEYGAAIWCDPHRWIPEAARLVRPGGRLVFLGTHPLAIVCTPASGERPDAVLHRDWFGLGRVDWRDVAVAPGGIEFALTPAGWIHVFAESGFQVVAHHELRAPAGADDARSPTSASWARRFPSEQVWVLDRR